MFAVAPGMIVEDARGKTIGTVAGVQQTASGAVRTVTVLAGERLATLDAANFSGSGDVLVSAIAKGDVKSEAKSQEKAQRRERRAARKDNQQTRD